MKAVFLVHSETSTGVILDLERFGAVARAANVLLVADAVSSLGAVPIETDAWGVDVLVSSSHKALITAPGHRRCRCLPCCARSSEDHFKAALLS